YAFDACSNLQSISMPASIETIYHDAFRKCYNLSKVIYDGTIDMWNDIVIDEGNECLTYAYYKTNPYASVANVSCEYDGESANVNVEFDFVNYAFDMYAGIYNSAGELQCIQKTTVNPGESATHITIDNPGMSFDEYSCKIMMWNKGGIMPLAKPVTVYVELTDLEQQFLNAANNAEFLEEMLQIVREWMPVHGVDEFVQLRISDQYSVCESLIEATPYDSIDKFRSMLKKQIDKYTASSSLPSSGSGSGGGDSSTGGSAGD
ncbi:MAG: leucine-rich repeat protein, partial [Clostridia bacterium]|nr:leucine-rich repeat protein [Clostridia bacterium]